MKGERNYLTEDDVNILPNAMFKVLKYKTNSISLHIFVNIPTGRHSFVKLSELVGQPDYPELGTAHTQLV